MKILMVNKFYYIKGGSETYLFGLKELLEEKGSKIIPFSMKDTKNFDTEYEKYFIDNIDYANMNFIQKIKGASKIIYNFQAKKYIRELIKNESPDIAHLHIFQHQISPSILSEIKKAGIPIVYTVHDLKCVCLNYKMLNNGKVCEECKGEKYYKCLSNKCVKNSRFKSLINVIEGYFHKINNSYENIDKYITPSKFYKQKLIEFGINPNKIEYIPNFVDIESFKFSKEREDYFIYLGRLSEEKGIKTLIDSMKQVNKANLKIIGTGPLMDNLENYKQHNKLNNVEFLGFKTGDELKSIVAKCMFVVIPSEWYENCPMSVIEAMSMGKPIIGADIGGIPELINKKCGLIFEPGNSNDLAQKINLLLNDKNMINEFAINARREVEEKYSGNAHLKKIESVYSELLSR